MATTIFDYMQKVKGVRDNIPNETEKIIKAKEQFILNLNRQAQLMQGIDADGGKIIPEYKPFTIQIKQLIGQPYDRVTLFYSGKFYAKFKIIYNKDMSFEIISTDNKTPKLMEKYGDDIFGLTKENQEILNNNIILPELWKFLKTYL
tara:strand:+ start:5032 stop:5472 length:441 start_codon:yes stop_codon:yes gene_type:complete